MQTFLPYPSFDQSARCLDRQRLGNQRKEVVQILKALAGITQGYKHHAVTKFWKGHEQALTGYGLAICDEWLSRGYRDAQREVIAYLGGLFPISDLPEWWDNPRVFEMYRGLLLFKNPEHYGAFGWNVEVVEDMDYTLFK